MCSLYLHNTSRVRIKRIKSCTRRPLHRPQRNTRQPESLSSLSLSLVFFIASLTMASLATTAFAFGVTSKSSITNRRTSGAKTRRAAAAARTTTRAAAAPNPEPNASPDDKMNEATASSRRAMVMGGLGSLAVGALTTASIVTGSFAAPAWASAEEASNVLVVDPDAAPAPPARTKKNVIVTGSNSGRVGTFHHVILQSKHQFMTAGMVLYVTNLTPGSECAPNLRHRLRRRRQAGRAGVQRHPGLPHPGRGAVGAKSR